MRNHFLLSALAAGVISFGSTAADAQSRVFKPRSSNPNAPDPTQLSTDVSQYSIEAQVGKIARNTDLLVRENSELRQELATTTAKLDQMEKRLESISRILTTGTGESIGSMVNKIRLKVGVEY